MDIESKVCTSEEGGVCGEGEIGKENQRFGNE